ncbi:MAG TPA: hypothetical protein VI979_03430 [archaeon]|uniref:Uncharacterized protein n=1 Tax=Candidatus Ryanbacteria bacterium RIFCSPHIGHO2_01_FULL_45_22 TaxID=1802114 RepID=A0A1G2G008_9BACT|nr:MAG: hypothetical protein A2719_01515 [Candidatus Ryanbacteria bacterium RIFCSPHIGHO2_01_FULL_45_22]HLD83879.1 hypothetical protein [archaeon]
MAQGKEPENYLLELAEMKGRGEISDERFFSLALLGFYDAMNPALTAADGHMIYRLSDFVPEDRRRTMRIYPCRTGSIIMPSDEILDASKHPYEYELGGGPNNWDSLEDWRKQWERIHRNNIPEMHSPYRLE